MQTRTVTQLDKTHLGLMHDAKSRGSQLHCLSGGLLEGEGGIFLSLSVSTKQLLPVPVACYIHANCQEVLDPGKGK